MDEDFVNYRKPSMFIGFPSCTFKCERECGKKCCQNSSLAQSPNIDVDTRYILKRYVHNNITSAVVCGGLEPFDSWQDLKGLITLLRNHTSDDIVIYTGYYEEEIKDKIELLKQFPNIIIKLGRFIVDDEPVFDDVLGVTLASSNQKGVKIS